MAHATPASAALPLITCRVCGTQHRAGVCTTCKQATPSFAVIRGQVRA